MIKCYLEDCFTGMKKIEDNKIDCVVTDPPYGINYKSGWTKRFEKIKNDDEIFDLDIFFKELDRVTKDDSAFYIYAGLQTLDMFMAGMRGIATIRNLIVVPRTQKGGNGSLTQSFSPQSEFIIFATKGKKKIEKTKILKPSASYLKDKRKKAPEYITRLPDYWEFAKAGVPNNLRTHPTEKDLSALLVAIQCSTKEGDWVLEPFAGSGSTLLACKILNRNCIGYEIDETYYNLTQERIREYESP